MKLKLTTLFAIGLLAIQAGAQDNKKPQLLGSKPVQIQPADATPPDKDKLSYAIGMSIGGNIKRQQAEVDVDTMAKAIKDVLSGATTRITEEQAQTTIRDWQMGLRAKMEMKNKEAGEKNKKEGEAFLADNKKKDGVKILPVDLNGKNYELQYKVLKEGTGATPKETDRVNVHYTGKLIDGTVFDSSVERGQPATFGVTQVIKGWTFALQKMKVGDKWKLFIPSDLAYGERGGGPKIGANAVLIFDVELLGIEAPPAAVSSSTNQVVSGEIIKVPSAEELKKGAKIEVIKPGDTNALKPK